VHDLADEPPTVVVIGGDGVGPEVVDEAVATLGEAGFRGSFVEADAGWDCWRSTGVALPGETKRLLERHHLCLFGATTSRPEVETEALARAEGLQAWRSPILELRSGFGLDVSIRPITSFPGNPGNALRRGVDGAVEEAVVDMVIVRQNTEGLYAGLEWRPVPEDVSRALATHPGWKPAWDVGDVALGVRVVTRRATERLVTAAFHQARHRGEARVVLAEKPNVLRATSGLVVEVAEQVALHHPGIELDVRNIDALLAQLVADPASFGVIATTNLFGDLLSDAAAGLAGGLGFAPSANIGDTVAVFEPVHGSAPDIAGRGVANPIAAILAAAMLAEHVGQPEVASRIRTAVGKVVARGGAGGTGTVGDAVRTAIPR
jgi:3-isopropylmalate dehydrogenase